MREGGRAKGWGVGGGSAHPLRPAAAPGPVPSAPTRGQREGGAGSLRSLRRTFRKPGPGQNPRPWHAIPLLLLLLLSLALSLSLSLSHTHIHTPHTRTNRSRAVAGGRGTGAEEGTGRNRTSRGGGGGGATTWLQSAPARRSRRTASTWPSAAARCSGLRPWQTGGPSGHGSRGGESAGRPLERGGGSGAGASALAARKVTEAGHSQSVRTGGALRRPWAENIGERETSATRTSPSYKTAVRDDFHAWANFWQGEVAAFTGVDLVFGVHAPVSLDQ